MPTIDQYPDSFSTDTQLLLHAAGVTSVEELANMRPQVLSVKLKRVIDADGDTIREQLTPLHIHTKQELPPHILIIVRDCIEQAQKILSRISKHN